MKALTAKDAKCGFGRLIDLARAEPVAVAKHGRPVATAVDEFERLKALEAPATVQAPKRKAKHGPQEIRTLQFPLVQL
jgi:antitoxin (DNA-binding transcriptional repressor) of toxin-antitoxin stability system